MAILFVLAVDSEAHPDAKQNAARYQRGHVLNVLPDDHQFTDYERTSGRYEFIHVDERLEDLRDLVRKGAEPAVKTEVQPIRAKRIDLDAARAPGKMVRGGDGVLEAGKRAAMADLVADVAAIEDAVIKA